MKNAMQLKAVIKNIAKDKHISAQLVMQNFILKGGFLIAAMVGLDTRATMDMDVTIKGRTVTEESVKKMFIDICEIDLQDDVIFEFKKIGEIREGDEYTGYRVSLSANYPPMSVPLKLDITTGDKITPKEIEYRFKLILEDREISVLAYNLETVMAEKLETVISRGDQNTRPRDYYDVYILAKLQYKNIAIGSLKAALEATSEKRGSTKVLKDYAHIIDIVRNSDIMIKQWQTYQKNFEYASDVSYDDVCDAVIQMMDLCYKQDIKVDKA